MNRTVRIISIAATVLIVGVVAIIALAGINNSTGPTFTDRPAPQLGIVVDKNNRVVQVLANSPAAQAGVQSGDLLTKVGTQNLTAATDTKAVVQKVIQDATIPMVKNGVNIMQSQPLTISLNRNGTIFTLSLTPASPPFSYVSSSAPLATPAPASNNFIL